jgi:hypothetical protein
MDIELRKFNLPVGVVPIIEPAGNNKEGPARHGSSQGQREVESGVLFIGHPDQNALQTAVLDNDLHDMGGLDVDGPGDGYAAVAVIPSGFQRVGAEIEHLDSQAAGVNVAGREADGAIVTTVFDDFEFNNRGFIHGIF